MRMFDNWVRMKSYDTPTSGLALPTGYEKNISDEDAFFEVIDCGPEVKKVKPGDVIACNPMGGVLRYKMPDEQFASYAVRDSEIFALIKR